MNDLKTQLAKLIEQHTYYCQEKYQQYNLPHLSSEKALKFQSEMTQSLTHFGIWLESESAVPPTTDSRESEQDGSH